MSLGPVIWGYDSEGEVWWLITRDRETETERALRTSGISLDGPARGQDGTSE